jgi:putative Holliday junction resolvase
VAHALSTLTRRAGRRFPLKALMAALEERQPAGFVIGLPLAPDGSEDQRAASARDAGRLIREKLRLPVDFQDERFTTARVLRTAKETGARPARAQQDVDSLAASLMLQLYLDRRRRA